MRPFGAAEFEQVRRAMLPRYLRMTSRSADGFIIDLGNALEKAGLDKVKVRWRGGEDGLFTATGQFEGNVEDALAVVLNELDDVAYGEDQAVAMGAADTDGFHVSFATWSPGIGLATVRIDVVRT